MKLIPLGLDEANALVIALHRHHGPVRGHKFSLGAVYPGRGVIGCAIVGRPVARELQDGLTLEVTRLCTDGTRNACSFLYGAAQRTTFALGYARLVTYILKAESGTSLRAAGWRLVGEVKGRSWDCRSRPRVDKHPTQDKLRFEVAA